MGMVVLVKIMSSPKPWDTARPTLWDIPDCEPLAGEGTAIGKASALNPEGPLPHFVVPVLSGACSASKVMVPFSPPAQLP